MRTHDDDSGIGCIFFSLSLLVSLVWLGLIAWLIVSVIDWLGRH